MKPLWVCVMKNFMLLCLMFIFVAVRQGGYLEFHPFLNLPSYATDGALLATFLKKSDHFSLYLVEFYGKFDCPLLFKFGNPSVPPSGNGPDAHLVRPLTVAFEFRQPYQYVCSSTRSHLST